MSDGLIIAIVAIVAIVVLGLAWFAWSRRRSRRLQEHYGSEYEHMKSLEGRRAAERDLLGREKRVASYELKELSSEQRRGYGTEWASVQARFVDDPQRAIVQADVLVQKVMQTRGYPLGDFENQAADISVDHPEVVRNYRLAHSISRSARSGRTSTEELRQGLLHYRALFDDLLVQEVAAARA